MPLRRSTVAGSWYPADPERLAREVDRHLDAAAVDALASPPRAIVVPHAGLIYSGPVAAFAYKAVSRWSYRAIVLVGPSHFVAFHGASLWPSGAWECPFGEVAVDAALADALRAESRDVVEHPAAHGREHSLEMQMPFIARLLPSVPIVPIVMGHQTRQTAESLGDALARAVAATESAAGAEDRVLLVASSDLSHYEDAQTAAEMDAVVLERVEALDANGLMIALEHEPRHACGGGPMVSVLRAAHRLGASKASVLRYADSGDVSGDKSSVVGYMAAVIW